MTLSGGAGNDAIIGGAGNDSIDLSGGGNDVVRITSKLDGHDVVTGFSATATGQDKVNLDGVFDALGVATLDRAGEVQIAPDGISDTLITIDTDGVNGFNNATDVTIKLVGVSSADVLTGVDVELGTLV
jgi:hypothetical protein